MVPEYNEGKYGDQRCVKMPDLFNLAQDSLQHLYNIYTAYVPVLVMLFPHNEMLHTLNTYPLLFSVILPTLLCAFFLLLILPLLCLVMQFVRRHETRKNNSVSCDFEEDSLKFKNHCDCSDKKDRYSNERRTKGNTNDEKYQVVQNFSLGILLLIMVFIYPFSIKLTKSILQSKFRNAISQYKADISRWLVVLYKYLSILFFDNKFSRKASTCSLISNPFKTGFWHSFDGNGTDYGDEYLEQLFRKQEEKIDIFSKSLATSSLTISFTTLFHLVAI